MPHSGRIWRPWRAPSPIPARRRPARRPSTTCRRRPSAIAEREYRTVGRGRPWRVTLGQVTLAPGCPIAESRYIRSDISTEHAVMPKSPSPAGSHLRAALVAAVAVILAAGSAAAGEVKVAVAANFAEAAREIGAAFETATGHHAVFSFGSTGQLFAQITQDAPIDRTSVV